MKLPHIIHKYEYIGNYKWDYCGQEHDKDYLIEIYRCTKCGKEKTKAREISTQSYFDK